MKAWIKSFLLVASYAPAAAIRLLATVVLQFIVAYGLSSASFWLVRKVVLFWRHLGWPVDSFFSAYAYFGKSVICCVFTAISLAVLNWRLCAVVLAFMATILARLVRFIAKDSELVEYLSDNPIEDESEDVLGRKSFIDKLQHLIDPAHCGNKSKCIGVWGDWGIGKTSCVKMCEKRFSKYNCWSRPIFIYFDSLRHTGSGDVVGLLFSVIAKSRWLRYYGIGGMLGVIGSRFWLARLQRLLDIDNLIVAVIRLVLGLFVSDENELVRLKQRLKDIDRRIVVVIDDLDRLPTDEMIGVIRMLKATGDLPNITYLILANEPYLSAGIGEFVPKVCALQIENGRDFIKKIITDTLVLDDTANHNDRYVKEFKTRVRSYIRNYWYRFDIDFCHRLGLLREFLDNMRDVKRLTNSVKVALEGFRSKDSGVGVSVDVEDLIVLEAVKMRLPDFYKALPRLYTEILTNKGNGLSEDQMNSVYLTLVPQDMREVSKNFLIEHLDARLKSRKSSNIGPVQRSWYLDSPADYKKYTQYRLASEFCFENYFDTSVSSKVVPRAMLETIFQYIESGNVDEAFGFIVKLNELSCLPELIYVIEHRYKTNAKGAPAILLRLFARLMDLQLKIKSLESRVLFSQEIIYSQILRAARRIVYECDEGKRCDFIKEIFNAEPNACNLFASFLNDEANRLQKNECLRFFRSEQDFNGALLNLEDRINKLFLCGFANDMPGVINALRIVSKLISVQKSRCARVEYLRDVKSVGIPIIDIVLLPVGDLETLVSTRRSVESSCFSYQGAVRYCIAEARRAASHYELPLLNGDWVVFVREGDLVSRDWFLELANASYQFSQDVVSFNFYIKILESVRSQISEGLGCQTNTIPLVEKFVRGDLVAKCFWNKLLKVAFFKGMRTLPFEEDALSRMVFDVLLQAQRYSHLDKVLVCHNLNIEDATRAPIMQSMRIFEQGRYFTKLVGMKAENVALDCLVLQIACFNSWKSLFKKQLTKQRVIDSLCPKESRLVRLRLRLCAFCPLLRYIVFARACFSRNAKRFVKEAI